MGKSTKAIALTAGLVGAAGFAALTAAPEQVSASTGTITYKEGATTVWQTPAFNQVKRYVVYNQQIEILGQKTVNGAIWYQIGANEWIPAVYMQIAGSANAAATTTPAQAASQAATASASSQAGAFTLKVTYTGGATTVWAGTSYSAPTGRYLTAGQTVTAVAKTVSAGETWYKLSTGGYVPGRFTSVAGAATSTQTTPSTSTTPSASTTPATQAPAATPSQNATSQNTATQAPTTTAPATSTPSTSTPATSNVTSGSYSLTISNPGSVVTVWATPAYAKANGTYLANGASVTANGKVVVAGETWYKLTSGGYVPARFTKTGSTSTGTSTSTSTGSTSTAPSTSTTPSKPTNTSNTNTSSNQTSTTSRAAKVQAILSLAKSLQGTPYVWGGTTLNGFDCSGFTQYVLQHAAGISLLRTSEMQATQGTRISVAQAQPGDLYFWSSNGDAYHVAIALGNGQYIAAPKPGDVVKIGATQYYQPSFATRLF
ncbi:C40 family peptidase [Lacticaseibacillus absianus]|uniref:C40 family peptidase n=1 Tax=Lacticaseibacillus absianus TaxID=2729623 RepID=UPI0015CC277C|nr:C40 family peptidase [Lacticaseibacillus absianus]